MSARKRSIYLKKMETKYAMENNIKYILAPMYQIDIDTLSKIRGEVEAVLRQYRNLEFHRKLFGIINNVVNDEFFEMMLNKWKDIQVVFNIRLNLKAGMIQAIRFHYNDDTYSLIYICKAIFLEWEMDIFSGNLKVSSIDFEHLDNVVFTDFYNNCLDLFSYIIDIDRNKLEIEYGY